MLEVKNISFGYGHHHFLDNLSFSLPQGNMMALVGESGCGKSTLLKLIYGLYDLSQGEIYWQDQPILGPKFHLIPGMGFIKYLAQDFDLMPFTTVAENVGHFLSNFYPELKRKRVLELLEIVEMTDFANTKVKFLSGGQMQRVALARVLALEPEVLLLDEPFSHIDYFRKNSLRKNLFNYLKAKNISCLIATHDSTDVLSFADDVLVIKEGKIIEQRTPHLCFTQPTNFYSASIFGNCSQIPADILGNDDMIWLFPHQLMVVDTGGFSVEVVQCFFMGSYYLIESQAAFGTVYFESAQSIEKSNKLLINRKKA